MRRYLRFSLATLFAATVLVALMTQCVHWRFFTPSGVYQTTKNGSALLGILGVEIKNGDTLDTVRMRLGHGTTIVDEVTREETRTSALAHPKIATDGYQEADKLVQYSAIDGFFVVLQFRDNRLIN